MHYTTEEGEDRKISIVLWYPRYKCVTILHDPECILVITLVYIFNARFTLNYKSPMLLKPTSQLRSRTGARGDGSSATDTRILWFPIGVWVSDSFSVCFFPALCFFQSLNEKDSLHYYPLYLCIIIFREVGFVQWFSPLELHLLQRKYSCSSWCCFNEWLKTRLLPNPLTFVLSLLFLPYRHACVCPVYSFLL